MYIYIYRYIDISPINHNEIGVINAPTERELDRGCPHCIQATWQ